MQPLQIRSLCRTERWSSSDAGGSWVMVRGEQSCFRDHEPEGQPIPAMFLRPVNFRATSDSQMAYVGRIRLHFPSSAASLSPLDRTLVSADR